MGIVLIYQIKSKNQLRIIALDQVTDAHNAGAIIRTAGFYNVDVILTPQKKSFGVGPSFFRSASGERLRLALS